MSLTSLQRRVLALALRLPEAEGFMIVGGAAMLLHGVVDRPTEDIDLFVERSGAVQRLAAALKAVLAEERLCVRSLQDAESFARMEVADGTGSTTRVDLALDARMRPSELSRVGPLVALDELAADKTLALFGRAQPRDFTDVDALARRLGRERLLELAAEKDRGFDRSMFAAQLGTVRGLQPDRFRLTRDEYEDLRARFEDWRRELLREDRGSAEQGLLTSAPTSSRPCSPPARCSPTRWSTAPWRTHWVARSCWSIPRTWDAAPRAATCSPRTLRRSTRSSSPAGRRRSASGWSAGHRAGGRLTALPGGPVGLACAGRGRG